MSKDRIRITEQASLRGQHMVRFYGRPVAIVGDGPGKPVIFLSKCKLQPKEKTEIISACVAEFGDCMRTKQTEEFWPRDTGATA